MKHPVKAVGDERARTVAYIDRKAAAARFQVATGNISQDFADDCCRILNALADDIRAELHIEDAA